MRLDIYLKEKCNFSREYSKDIIKKGLVAVNGSLKNIKPSFNVSDKDSVTLLEGSKPKYVGRGGFKLEKALNVFNIELRGVVCADIGASTGGFTDCMLQNGAKKVYAVDVGHGQLSEKLKNDSAVVSMENTNVNDVVINDDIGFVAVDVSFVSLSAVLQSIYRISGKNSDVVMLIKPQFEVGRGRVGKNGIVRDKKLHRAVIRNVLKYIGETGFILKGLTPSPIKGGDGNVEYLAYAVKREYCVTAHNNFNLSDIVLTDFEEEKRNG